MNRQDRRDNERWARNDSEYQGSGIAPRKDVGRLYRQAVIAGDDTTLRKSRGNVVSKRRAANKRAKAARKGKRS